MNIGPGRIVGSTVEVLVGETWRRFEPVRTPLGTAILALVENDPQPCATCGYYNCQCSAPSDPHLPLTRTEELPY